MNLGTIYLGLPNTKALIALNPKIHLEIPQFVNLSQIYKKSNNTKKRLIY